jgi:hypothetical protein
MMADDFICGTVFETMAMQARWKRLVKEAIKAKGGNVNSIAPEELEKLVTDYLEEHPEQARISVADVQQS